MGKYARRDVLRAAGTTALVAGLAGCSGGDDDTVDAEPVDEEPDYGDWFDNVGNYESTLDLTDRDEVDVAVGSGNGLQYSPVAIQVTTGTTVVWEWTGQGGGHDVVEEGGAFESERTADEGHTFSHTFEETGIFKYVCVPHEANGMKGAVSVVD